MISFFKFEVSVSVDIIEESPIPFPAVTICQTYPYDLAKKNTQDYFSEKNLMRNISANSSNLALEQVISLQTLMKATIFADKQLNESQKMSLGYDIDSLIISCYFNNVQCNMSDFTLYYTFEFGNCYTFNKKTGPEKNLKKSSKPGRLGGLTLELFTGLSGMFDNLTIEKGIYVSVHNNSQIPLTRFDGVRVTSGHATDISIRRSYQLKKDSPFNDCRLDTATILDDDSEYFKKTVSLSKYSQYLCYEICLQYEFIIKECNCSDPSVPTNLSDSTENFCNTIVDVKCILTVRNRFDETSISSICAKYCPAECEKMRFTYQLSTSDYPTNYYYDMIKNQPSLKSKFERPRTSIFQSVERSNEISLDSFRESVLMLNVYYGDLAYSTTIESPAYTFDSLMGILG